MKTRQEIKALAKEAMAQQRGTAILIYVVLILISLVGQLLVRLTDPNKVFIVFLGALIAIAAAFIEIVFAVGSQRAFIKIFKREHTSLGEVVSSLGVNFWRKLGGILWMVLWVCIWSLLFVIPGIVKSFSYLLTPYILADCPNVKATEALKLSMRMTKGHRCKLFVLYLSFIGWMLLSVLTLLILDIVYVGPYISTTMAGYYIELRDQALASGAIKPEELQ